MPPEAETWLDSELHLYFGSNGDIWPRGKRPTWASKPSGGGSGPSSKGVNPLPPRDRPIPPGLKPHFATLGLAETTPPDVIRRHYHTLARELHPDKHPDDLERKTERFKDVSGAYDAIKKVLRF